MHWPLVLPRLALTLVVSSTRFVQGRWTRQIAWLLLTGAYLIAKL
jgi:hypothetical protein